MENATSSPFNTLLERFNRWIQESIMIKLLSIGFLMLILLIPSAWIRELIYERQQRADEAMEEVTSKWSGSQTLTGPVLVIPYTSREVIDRGKDGKEIREHIENAFFLPEHLDASGTIDPEVRHRGIFDAVVYKASLTLQSTFSQPDFKKLSIPEDLVRWDEAYYVFGITDVRGINDSLAIIANDVALEAEPSNDIGVTIRKTNRQTSDSYFSEKPTPSGSSNKGIMAKAGWHDQNSFASKVDIQLSLKGSRSLEFIPVGKTTAVKLSGQWNNPSFDGAFLPDSHEISENSFAANWKILHFNRPFSQQWVQNNQELGDSNFGVKLLLPVDQYQKSMRTAKYGALIILLTFMALFLLEITQKIRIHPFQYILIGAALTIYYTLLLSLSEHIGYNAAYVIASLATVTLVSLYSRSFFPAARLSIQLAALMGVFYTFIFLIIMEQDFSLLLGSVGLFIIIATLMYFSRNVKWYKEVPQ